MPKKKLPRCLPKQSGEVVRFSDYEKRSRNPDSQGPRDPCDATIIIMRPARDADETAPSECPCM